MIDRMYYILPFPPPVPPEDPRTMDNIRKSLDGTQCVLFWPLGEEPAELSGQGMTQDEVIAALDNDQWTTGDEI